MKNVAENHAIILGQNLMIVQGIEEFLLNLAFHHCL
jgi:hypothetical protein